MVVTLGMVFGWQLPGARLNLRILKTDGTSSGLRAVFGYGVAYAVAALSCSLALLLAVVAQAVSTGSLAGLLAVFAAYALGSSVVLVLLSLGAAVARDVLARHVRRICRLLIVSAGRAYPRRDLPVALLGSGPVRPGRPGRSWAGRSPSQRGAVGFISGNWPIITLTAVALALRRRSKARHKTTAQSRMGLRAATAPKRAAARTSSSRHGARAHQPERKPMTTTRNHRRIFTITAVVAAAALILVLALTALNRGSETAPPPGQRAQTTWTGSRSHLWTARPSPSLPPARQCCIFMASWCYLRSADRSDEGTGTGICR